MDIYVGNLSYGSTEDDIRGLFSVYGTVERVNIITDQETGRSRGFCFREHAERRRGAGRYRGPQRR